LIPEKILKIFNSDEFELLLNGQPFIDVDDWRSNTFYKGYDEYSPVFLFFNKGHSTLLGNY
jgi:E3 ubiquitin-protein ligase HUWE1